MAERSIIVTGSKGGVGTTTVALNVAVHMTQLTKKRVGLIEFARPFGQISLMLDFDPRFTLLDALERIDRLDLALLASLVTRHQTGVEILAGPLHALCAPTSVNWLRSKRCCASSNSPARPSPSSSLISAVNAAEWARVLLSADTLLLVAEPSALALGMLERYLQARDLAGLDRNRFQIIVNRWRQKDDEPVAKFEKDLKQSFFARLPNDFRPVSEAVTLGIPLTAGSNNPLGGRYRDLAARLMSVLPREAESRAESPLAVGQK